MSNPVTYLYPPVSSDPGVLYDGFKAYMQANIPGWQPYSGELDDWLGRAFTFIASQLMEITSDVATSIFRYFGAYIIGNPPYDATPAQGTVTVTVQDSAGYTIPAFTQMSFTDPTGTLQGFENLADVVIAPGSTTATFSVQAMDAGAAGNGCSGAGDLDASAPITFITALSMAASSSGGTDDEDDAAYLGRLTSLLTTVTPSPITVSDFTTIAETESGVGRAFTLGAFNPANWTTTGNTHTTTVVDGISSTANVPVGAPISGSGIPAGAFVKSVDSSSQITISAAATATASGVTLTIGGQLNQGGEVTTWVTASDGTALSPPSMSTIQSNIQAMCLFNVVYNVEAPTYTTVSVTANVLAWASADSSNSDIQTAVQTAITNYLEPVNFGQIGATLSSQWLNETVVRLGALQAVCMGVDGVHYVSSLTINGSAADLALGGVVPLPTPGTITVTVTTG